MDPHPVDLQQLAQSIEILRNVIYIVAALGGAAGLLIGFVLKAKYLPRKEYDDKQHSLNNKRVAELGALRAEIKNTDEKHALAIGSLEEKHELAIAALGDKHDLAIAAMRERVDRHEVRLTQGEGHFGLLDAAMKALPTETSMNHLALAIEGLRGDVRVVGESAKVTAAQVNRIDNYLRRQEATT